MCIALWRRAEDGPPDAALLDRVNDSLTLRAATVHLESTQHPSLRHGAGTDGQLLTGLISLWVDSYQDIEVPALIAGAGVTAWHAYLVTESVPQSYGDSFTWPEGERSPGLSLVTLLDKPPAVSDAEFYRCWHELHRLTTAQCHPFQSYVRNEVVRPLTGSADSAPPYRGIVTESCNDVQDLLDPHRFYVSGGDDDQLRRNSKRVLGEVVQFIELSSIQVAPMHEHVLRRLAPTSP